MRFPASVCLPSKDVTFYSIIVVIDLIIGVGVCLLISVLQALCKVCLMTDKHDCCCSDEQSKVKCRNDHVAGKYYFIVAAPLQSTQ